MFAQANFPSIPLTPEELDHYLDKGWFRMGQSIFTCTYIHLRSHIYRVFWLRILLEDFTNSSTYQKLCKINSKFTINIQKASITPQKEDLYQVYKSGISFESSETLETLLFGDSEENIYNTVEITIHDGEKLIAVGFFDLGNTSAAGISSFYDPAYKKYSLGKFLIYQKMLYCKNQQMQYFYLGYFAPGCRSFDYKLEIAKESLEYFDICTKNWDPINNWDSTTGSIEETTTKLKDLQLQLNKINIENRLFRYSYFQANLFKELQGYQLFDYLFFVYCFQYNPEVVNPIVVYDIRDHRYHLVRCVSMGKPEEIAEHTDEYTAHVLKITNYIFSTDSAEVLAKMMSRVFANVNEVSDVTNESDSDPKI